MDAPSRHSAHVRFRPLSHEDSGVMGQFVVVDKEQRAGTPERGHAHGGH
ncbi:hypothetical protein [Streptomyces sp. NPDC055140]